MNVTHASEQSAKEKRPWRGNKFSVSCSLAPGRDDPGKKGFIGISRPLMKFLGRAAPIDYGLLQLGLNRFFESDEIAESISVYS